MESYPAPPIDHEISIDANRLRKVVRHNLLKLLLLGFSVCLTFAVWQLCLTPQSYRGEVSIAMQQSNSAFNGLSSILGSPSQSRKYIGLLKSRNLAEIVENQVHLQEFYHLKSHQDALDLLMDNIKPEDGKDGLLLVQLTLTGPPALGLDPEHRRQRAKQLVAQATNLYFQALADYYDASNTERDNVLLHAAEDETKRARLEYEQATQEIRNFVRSLNQLPVRSTPTGTNVESGGASADLIALYQQQDQVEAEIRSATAIQQTQQRLTTVQLNNLNILPAEDILLNDARAAQHRAESQLKKRLDVYGPDNPLVKEAQDNLKYVTDELNRQKQGVRQWRTTDQVDLAKRLEGLRAKHTAILTRISSLENRVSTKRGLTAQLEILRNEQIIHLKQLEEALVKSVEVRLTAVSGKSMISMVDSALPPRQGSPSLLRTIALGIFLALLAMIVTVTIEYLKLARRKTDTPLSSNG